MIVDEYRSKIDAAIIKVGDRWYICSDAVVKNIGYGIFNYYMPTLKFKMDTFVDGYDEFIIEDMTFEIHGTKRSLKLEYIQ